MKKSYKCKFQKDVYMNAKTKDYKKCCDFKNRAEKEHYRKFYDNHLFCYSLKCKIQEDGEPITVISLHPFFL